MLPTFFLVYFLGQFDRRYARTEGWIPTHGTSATKFRTTTICGVRKCVAISLEALAVLLCVCMFRLQRLPSFAICSWGLQTDEKRNAVYRNGVNVPIWCHVGACVSADPRLKSYFPKCFMGRERDHYGRSKNHASPTPDNICFNALSVCCGIFYCCGRRCGRPSTAPRMICEVCLRFFYVLRFGSTASVSCSKGSCSTRSDQIRSDQMDQFC